MTRALALCAVIIAFLLCSCGGGSPVDPPPPEPLPDSASFSAHVIPVFLRHSCLTCHGSEGGLSVSSVPNLLAGGLHGPAVIAGSADSSLLIQKVGPAPPIGSRMPEGGMPLSARDIELLRLWVNQGAKDN